MEETILADDDVALAQHREPDVPTARRRGGSLSRVVVSAVLIVLLLSAGVVVARVLVAARTAPPRHELVVVAPMVKSMIATAGEVSETFSGYGTATADQAATLSAEVSSVILEMVNDLEAGDAVAYGQALIRLDSREFELTVARAEALAAAEAAQLREVEVERANLEQLLATAVHERRIAEDERRRVSDLFELGEAHKREYDITRLAYQQTVRLVQNYERELALLEPRRARIEAARAGHEASAAIAQLNVERCLVRAPFAGRVDALLVEAGDRVQPGTPLLELIDPAHVDVAVRLPASVYELVSVGGACMLQREIGGGYTWRGEVARKAPSTSRETRTFAVHIDVDNSLQTTPLVPGTFVHAVVEGPTHAEAIVVPRSAIRRGSVMVVEDGIARRRQVSVRRFLGDNAWIEGPVQDGEPVVLSHLDSLSDGAPVRLAAADAKRQGGGGD